MEMRVELSLAEQIERKRLQLHSKPLQKKSSLMKVEGGGAAGVEK